MSNPAYEPAAPAYDEQQPDIRYCAMPPQPEPVLPPGIDFGRARAIILGRAKWSNGTVLHYYFFDKDTDGSTIRFTDGSTRFVSWVGAKEQQDAVRQAFDDWKGLGVGLKFTEVQDRSEAEIRIGFLNDFDGSWSYVGKDVLQVGANSRTMNFGWDLTTTYGKTTALHEIGHSLGLPHEHQNPFSGIEWDEDKVYAYFGGPPNDWDRETTFHNVLRKLSTNEVDGSPWDPDSIMEYRFPAGLILQPEDHRNGVSPPGTLSAVDKQYILQWYPPLDDEQNDTLTPHQSVDLGLSAGEQADFNVLPPGTRKYQIGTFGEADTLVTLFEEVNGELRFVAGDDDSGEDRNALISVKLFQGRKYVVRIRLYYSWASGQTSIMYW